MNNVYLKMKQMYRQEITIFTQITVWPLFKVKKTYLRRRWLFVWKNRHNTLQPTETFWLRSKNFPFSTFPKVSLVNTDNKNVPSSIKRRLIDIHFLKTEEKLWQRIRIRLWIKINMINVRIKWFWYLILEKED